MIRVRFAVPPAGVLFVGSARIALANHLFARHNQGEMVLRFDDPDQHHIQTITQDLRWLGIAWHSSIHQSEHQSLYQTAIERLKCEGLLYPCFETEAELRAKKEFRRKRKKPVTYDRAMLALTPAQRAAAEAGGKRPHWRLRLSGRTLEWRDMLRGDRVAALPAVSDPVIVRADGSPAPILASVVDDIAAGTTHIIRGEDSIGNTAIQLELFELLTGGRAAPRFAHLPALDAETKHADRRAVGGLSLRALRADGVESGALIACMAGLAGEPAVWDVGSAPFDLAAFAATRFDVTDILAMNRRLLQRLDFADVAERLPSGATEAFWLAVRGSLDLLREARGWWDVVAGTIVPPAVEDERDLLAAAEALLPAEPWDDQVWTRWIAALEQATARSGETLQRPLRLALTGEDAGPDMAGLLPLIGRIRAASRLRIAAG